MDQPGVRDRLPEIRREELDVAAAIIGYDEVVMLGYRDSGMPGTPENSDPRSFAQAPFDEAVERLVAIVRRERPQVMVTYPEDQSGYPHPDHVRSHEISTAAFDAAGDPERYPDAGPPWEPLKLYWVTWSARRIQRTHETFLELGLESPYDEERLARTAAALAEATATTVIDVSRHARVQADALRAHATQVDPNSKFWFGLPPEVARSVHPVEEYILARSLVGGPVSRSDDEAGVEPAERETDLFAGVARLASR
jgi:mycothiol S-conjugate amidase